MLAYVIAEDSGFVLFWSFPTAVITHSNVEI